MGGNFHSPCMQKEDSAYMRAPEKSMPMRLQEVIQKAGIIAKLQTKGQYTQSVLFRATILSIKIC